MSLTKPAAAVEAAPTGDPPAEVLADLVRRHLRLSVAEPVVLHPVGEHSNINHVYRVAAAGRVIYLKQVPENPKRLAVSLPRHRILSEARALAVFRDLARGAVLVPEVLFVDAEQFVLGMSDVGEGRAVLFDRLAQEPDLLAEQGAALGRALARVHEGTRGLPPLRPAAEQRAVHGVIFEGLLAPGVRALEPRLWDEVVATMEDHAACLVHADLWSKNLLVRRGQPVAVVDFEGAIVADPALDLGTLLAVAALPALESPPAAGAARRFAEDLLGTYRREPASGAEAAATCRRALRYTGVFLAARGFGPFAYGLSEASRRRIAALAPDLLAHPPAELNEWLERVFPPAACHQRP